MEDELEVADEVTVCGMAVGSRSSGRHSTKVSTSSRWLEIAQLPP